MNINKTSLFTTITYENFLAIVVNDLLINKNDLLYIFYIYFTKLCKEYV
jgi:hypothetical protein